MACMVLPSETARLVYGYLVKEKLDNIALQFLENSPYLTDCYHIVKSGYQFNTKFMYKELHELIQEYSTILNSVNRKISLLSKSSPLYKNIKLQCENLSEMIDMILFWGCNESEFEGNPLEGIENKAGAQQTGNKTDKIIEMTINNNDNDILPHDSECNEYVNSSTPRNDQLIGENEEMFQENEYNLNSKFPDFKNDSNQTNSNMNCVENINVDDVGNEIANEMIENYSEIQSQKQNNISEVTEDNSEMNISVINLDPNTPDKSNNIELSLVQNEQDVGNVNNQIEIVRIEKDNHENEENNQLSNTYVENLDGLESGLNMENGSVYYVSHDVGNLTLNQDRNQIIVIPIDYAKAQTSFQAEIGNEQIQCQSQNIISNEGNCIDGSNGIIFEDIPVATNSAPCTTPTTILPFCSTFVDDNIITESTYLNNKGLIYELEGKVKPQIFQEPPPIKVTAPAPPPVQAILWSQLIENPDTKNRRILPKTTPGMPNTPIVVVQPLMKRSRAARATKPRSRRKKETCPTKKNVKNPSDTNVQTKEEVLTMPSITSPSIEGSVQNESTNMIEELVKEVQTTENSEKAIESVNLKVDEKKTETPVVVLNTNPKRLSFSTPRRRSHIRALEFETPPKSGNAKKKSRTSPKVKVEELKVTNKNVRNTLFKSPDSDTTLKTPPCLREDKDCTSNVDSFNNDTQDQTLALPLDAINPKPKFDASWRKGPGASSLNKDPENKTVLKKSWDTDLREFISSGISSFSENVDVPEKKRSRKQKKGQKNEKKSNKKKQPSQKKEKVAQIIPSPSKISLTAKRNTYSISGNEEGSPVRTLLEELDLVTPFKDSEPVRDVEETPISKFLRENVNGLDIDLNIINTPIFPPTPNIVVTPDCDDSLPIAGSYYYTPLKDNAKEKTPIIEDSAKTEEEDAQAAESLRKKGAKETHEKVIGELVSKAKEIIGLKSSDKDESTGTKPLSGKVLSMVKIQMITQCDKKLCENIPINDESIDEETEVDITPEEGGNFDLKRELEEKRQRALKKIKSVKENFGDQNKKKKGKKSVKRKISDDAGKPRKRIKRVSVSDSSASEEKDLSGSSGKEVEIFHSTPVDDSSQSLKREESNEGVDRSMLDEIREEFPCFSDDGEFSELPLKTRKKLHYIKHFLKSNEVSKFLESNEIKTLKLKRSRRKFFQVFYKWLKHPHARELNTSERTKNVFKEYKNLFEKIKIGLSLKINGDESGKEDRDFSGIYSHFSDDETDVKYKENLNKKEDDLDDGPVSVLPLKKRKSNVQPLRIIIKTNEESGDKTLVTEDPSRTQTLLQDIDVDRFLSQIHGQENR